MAWQQDYLLRMIQDLNLFMSRIVKLRREAKPEEALDLLTGESTRISGIPPTLVYALSDDDLIETLTARGALEPERCFTIAELFREEGMIHEELGNETEAGARLAKAARLYAEALRLAPPENDKIDPSGLRETLAHVHASWIDGRSIDRVLDTLVEFGALDVADNVIYELLESDEDGGQAFRARRVWHDILAQSDYTLARSNLEREEIEEALAKLD